MNDPDLFKIKKEGQPLEPGDEGFVLWVRQTFLLVRQLKNSEFVVAQGDECISFLPCFPDGFQNTGGIRATVD